ncbi:MAG: hypothetical protein AB7H97_08265 [Pseudobdellovibrionaceae bacterium]
MNVRRGLLRAWIVLSVLWVVPTAYISWTWWVAPWDLQDRSWSYAEATTPEANSNRLSLARNLGVINLYSIKAPTDQDFLVVSPSNVSESVTLGWVQNRILEVLIEGLRQADAKGDTVEATRIAHLIRKMFPNMPPPPAGYVPIPQAGYAAIQIQEIPIYTLILRKILFVVQWVALPPLALLVFGVAVVWIIRGFRSA